MRKGCHENEFEEKGGRGESFREVKGMKMTFLSYEKDLLLLVERKRIGEK